MNLKKNNMKRYTFSYRNELTVLVDASDEKEARHSAKNSENWEFFNMPHEDYLEIMDIQTLCDICNEPEDEDGRCGCTNKDSE